MADLKVVDMQSAKAALDRNKDIVLLDVRTQEEYREGHIKGALNMPLQNLRQQIGLEVPDKGQDIYLYCRSGMRVLTAGEILLNLGYTHVYNMGGIIDWPYEIER